MNRAFKGRSLDGLQVKNAFIKTATYEGMYDDGLPNQKLLDFHVAMANGNVGLTTIAYASVSADGRTFEDQMYIHDRSLAELRKIVAAVHRAGGRISIQLSHCGYFSKNTKVGRLLAPSRIFNEYGFMSGLAFSKAMSEEDIRQVATSFARAARQLKEIGFDAIEIHMGHGYLLSQFLSPWTNRRKDQYGGSIENRARFPLEVFQQVKVEVGLEFPILVKLNLSDGFPGGFSIEDCKYVIRELKKMNCVAVILSGGFTSRTPFYLLRGDVPLKGMIKNGSSLAEKVTMSLFGPWLVKEYAFSPNFFLNQAKEIRSATKMPLVYLGGVDSMVAIEEIMHAGFDFIAIGRALIHDPDFLIKLESGQVTKSGCTHCNECIVEMDRGGVKCVLNNQ